MNQSILDTLNSGVYFQLIGDFDKARASFKAVIEKDNNNAVAFNNLGFLLCQQNKWLEALPYLEKAIALNPESDSAFLNKGHAHLALGEIEAAYNDYTRAIEINNENFLAWESYAKFFTLIKQPEEAIKAWYQAINVKPDVIEYKVELAICLVSLSRFDEAGPIFENVLRKDPKNARAWTHLGIIYLMRKDYGIAEELLHKSLGLVPEDQNTRYHLALVYLATGEQTKAEHELQRIVQLYPENTKARTDYAVLLLSRNELEPALTELNKCLADDPNFPKAKYYQALVLHQMGQSQTSKSILQEIAADADNNYAAQAKAYIDKYLHA